MIHASSFSAEIFRAIPVADWWAISPSDLDRMAPFLIDESPRGSWVRRGDHFVVIANQKLGSLATKLDAELSALATESQRVMSGGEPGAALRAAAAYHLRFENIHPLSEGNGRVGRAILAAQIHQAFRIPPEEFLAALLAQEMDYLAVFASDNPAIMFELLLDLLAQLTGQVVPPESARLPFSILPLYPDRRPLIKKPSQPIRVTRHN